VDVNTTPAQPNEPIPQREVRVRRLMTIFIWGVVIVFFLYFKSALQMILLGFLAAACLTAALRPLRRSIPGPRWFVGPLVGLAPLLLLAGLITLLGWFLAPRIRYELERWPVYHERLNVLLANWSARFGLDEPMTVQSLAGQLGTFIAGPEFVTMTFAAIVGLVIALAFIFIGTIYMLAIPPRTLSNPLSKLLPPNRRPQLHGALNDLEPRLRWWVIGTLCSMTTVGVLSFIGFKTIGLEPTVPLSLLAAFSEIVPTIGPTFAFLVALLFAAAQEDSPILGVIIIWGILQTFEAYLITPLVMRQAVKIPPVITLFTVVLWGRIFGIGGLLLAIPINLVIWTVVDHFLIRSNEERRVHLDTS
jgi:predicted PurR-regulated permease PerM